MAKSVEIFQDFFSTLFFWWVPLEVCKNQTSPTGLQRLSSAPSVSRGPAAGQSISPVLLDNNINIGHIFWPKFSANFPICVWRWTTSHAHCTGSFIQAEKIRDTAAGFWFTAEKCLLLLHINNQINCGSSAGGSWRKQCRVESRQVDIFSVLWECLQLSMSRSSGISSDIFPHFLHTIWIWSKLPRGRWSGNFMKVLSPASRVTLSSFFTIQLDTWYQIWWAGCSAWQFWHWFPI